MFREITFWDVLPLRAVAFQLFFLLIAIAIEATILHKNLSIDYKTSAQYSATINLLSTVIGWLIFFNLQLFLPQGLKVQLISYIFFEQFFSNSWLSTLSPILITVSLGVFLGTFWIKLQGLKFLEILLEKNTGKKDKEDEKVSRFRGRGNQVKGFRANSRAYAVFVGNACSFSVILLLLLLRIVDQTYFHS